MVLGRPIVIAHRGASGYLPEHTLESKVLAHAMGADYLEQDVVLTRDGVPIVMHDIYLDSTTDVAERFPGRARHDGRFYALDFDLAEIRQLRVHERCATGSDGRVRAVYGQRFPAGAALFRVPTLAEEIELIAGLDLSRGRRTGLYIELKSPNRHRSAGLDPCAAVLQVLADAGYAQRSDQVFLQCFDDRTLRALRDQWRTPLPLIQLIADNEWGEDSEVDYEFLRTPGGLSYVAQYAQGVGPWISHLYLGRDDDGAPVTSDLVAQARQRGLLVHPYTFRRDDLPAGVASFEQLLDIFCRVLRVDGLFTDFPDLVLDYLQRMPMQPGGPLA